jgi:hypothetical protein
MSEAESEIWMWPFIPGDIVEDGDIFMFLVLLIFFLIYILYMFNGKIDLIA